MQRKDRQSLHTQREWNQTQVLQCHHILGIPFFSKQKTIGGKGENRRDVKKMRIIIFKGCQGIGQHAVH